MKAHPRRSRSRKFVFSCLVIVLIQPNARLDPPQIHWQTA